MRAEREGLGYRAAILDEGVSLSIDRIVESRGETYGELTVTRAPEGHLMRSRIALSSSNSRQGAAGYLARRARGPDWVGMLEAFCVDVLSQERQGSPAVPIGRRAPRPQVEFVLEPLLPVGKPTILYGQEGTGKSTLAANIAVAVASGQRTFSRWHVPRPRGVLVLDWEADEADWNDLVAAVAAGNGIEVPETIWHSACARPLTDDVHRVARLVQEHAVGLVIVDSVGLASPSTRDGADAAEGALRLFSGLRALGTTSLLIDHVNKSDESGRNSRPYGSVYKPALARATYELRAGEQVDDDGTRHLALFHRKGNTTAKQAPVGIAVHRSDTECLLLWEPVELSDEAIAKGATLVDRLKDAMRLGTRTVEELAELTESDNGVIRATLNRHKKLFVAVSKPGEKANSWALLSPVTPVTGVTEHVPHGMRNSVTPPKGGVVTRVPQTSRPFDAIKRENEERLA